MARNTLVLIKDEKDSGQLRRLADLTLALKPILDELPDFPDLGLELREYAVLKMDTGPSAVTEKFRLSLGDVRAEVVIEASGWAGRPPTRCATRTRPDLVPTVEILDIHRRPRMGRSARRAWSYARTPRQP
jgi:hypothetical protein